LEGAVKGRSKERDSENPESINVNRGEDGVEETFGYYNKF
jgi:hypothetical protein